MYSRIEAYAKQLDVDILLMYKVILYSQDFITGTGSGFTAAFGDINSDKLTDVFILNGMNIQSLLFLNLLTSHWLRVLPHRTDVFCVFCE